MFFKGDVSPINALRQVEVTENGFISETKEGEIRFDSRHARLTNPESTRSQITFSDADGSTYSFSEITQDDPINTISNENSHKRIIPILSPNYMTSYKGIHRIPDISTTVKEEQRMQQFT